MVHQANFLANGVCIGEPFFIGMIGVPASQGRSASEANFYLATAAKQRCTELDRVKFARSQGPVCVCRQGRHTQGSESHHLHLRNRRAASLSSIDSTEVTALRACCCLSRSSASVNT